MATVTNTIVVQLVPWLARVYGICTLSAVYVFTSTMVQLPLILSVDSIPPSLYAAQVIMAKYLIDGRPTQDEHRLYLIREGRRLDGFHGNSERRTHHVGIWSRDVFSGLLECMECGRGCEGRGERV